MHLEFDAVLTGYEGQQLAEWHCTRTLNDQLGPQGQIPRSVFEHQIRLKFDERKQLSQRDRFSGDGSDIDPGARQGAGRIGCIHSRH